MGVLLSVTICILIVPVVLIAVRDAFQDQIKEINRGQSQAISILDRSRVELAAEAIRIAGNSVITDFLEKENPSNQELQKVNSEFRLQYAGEVEISEALVVDRKQEYVISTYQRRRVPVESYAWGGYELRALLDKFNQYGNCYIGIGAADGEYRQFFLYRGSDGYVIIFELEQDSVNTIFSCDGFAEVSDACIYYNGLDFAYKGDPELFEEKDYAYMRENRLDNLKADGYMAVFLKIGRTACISKITTQTFFRDILAKVWKSLAVFVVVYVVVVLILWRYANKINFLNIQHTLEMAIMKQRIDEINLRSALIKTFVGLNLQQNEFMALEQYFAGGGEQQDKGGWRCVIIQLTDEHTMEALDVRSGITSISDKIRDVSRRFSAFEKAEIVSLNHQMLGIVIRGQNADSRETFPSVLRQLQELIREELQLSVSIVVSELCKDSNDFAENALEVYRMTEQTFFQGTDSILQQNTVEEKGIIPYPATIEQAMLTELENQDIEKYRIQLNRFMERVCQTTPAMARCYLSALTTNIVNYTRLGANPVDSSIVQQITECETLEQIRKILSGIITETPERMESKEAEFFRIVSAMIEQKFANPEFCLADVAMQLDISASYAGKKFRNSFNQSFNTYLADFRVEKAVEYLGTTNYKIKVVGEMCGFRTTAYFTTIFKKCMKVSPQEYRKNLGSANN